MIALSVLVGAFSTARADTPSAGRERVGTIKTLTQDTLELRLDDGSTETMFLSPNLIVVLGAGIGREDLKPGEMIALAAAVVPVGGGFGYVARSFMAVDAAIPAREQADLVTMFVQPSHAAEDARHLDQRAVSGRLQAVVAGMILDIQQQQAMIRVKLGPEADGYRLRWGAPSDLAPGVRILVPLAEPVARNVLILQRRP